MRIGHGGLGFRRNRNGGFDEGDEEREMERIKGGSFEEGDDRNFALRLIIDFVINWVSREC